MYMVTDENGKVSECSAQPYYSQDSNIEFAIHLARRAGLTGRLRVSKDGKPVCTVG